jgi:hypothetical protein
LQESWQKDPEERTDEQFPRVPFTGGDTEHAFGAHDCVAVNVPFEQDVTEPTML